MNHKAITIFLLILILTLAISSCARKTTEKQIIKFGVILPLSGSNAHTGEGVKNAVEMLKPELKNKNYDYEIIYEDDQLNPKMTSNSANKLITFDKVDAIFSYSAGSGNVVTPLAEENKVIHFGTTTDPNVAKGLYNFIHVTRPKELAELFVSELEKRNIKKIAIIGLNQQGVKATLDEVKEKLKNTNVEIVYEEYFNAGEKDFRTSILKAEEKAPEIYMLEFFPPELELLAKQIKELNINKPITAIVFFSFSKELGLFNGNWFVDVAKPTNDFTTRYENKYNMPPTVAAPNVYDDINMVVSAYENLYNKNKKPATEEIAKEILRIKNFEGSLGKLSLTEEGIVISKASLREVKDGKLVYVR